MSDFQSNCQFGCPVFKNFTAAVIDVQILGQLQSNLNYFEGVPIIRATVVYTDILGQISFLF